MRWVCLVGYKIVGVAIIAKRLQSCPWCIMGHNKLGCTFGSCTCQRPKSQQHRVGLPQKQSLAKNTAKNTGRNSTKIEALKYCQHFRAFKKRTKKKTHLETRMEGKVRARPPLDQEQLILVQSFYIGDLERKLCKFKCWPLLPAPRLILPRFWAMKTWKQNSTEGEKTNKKIRRGDANK